MLTTFLTAAFAFALVLLPVLLVFGGIVLVGALIGAAVLALIPSIPSLAAMLLIGWAIYKGATRNRLRSSDSGLRS